jgi:hypothetical protein
VSVNVTSLVSAVAGAAQTIKIEQFHQTFLGGRARVDQTLNPVAECAIEFILRKL